MQRTSGEIEKKNINGSHYACVRCRYREHADVNYAKNIRNNFISSAAKTQKVEQVVCQSAKRLGDTETSHQPCAGGN
jgi:transposase